MSLKKRIHKYRGKHGCRYCQARFDSKEELDEHHLSNHGVVSKHPKRDTPIHEIYRKYYMGTKHKKHLGLIPKEEDRIYYESVKTSDGYTSIKWEYDMDKLMYVPTVNSIVGPIEIVWDRHDNCYKLKEDIKKKIEEGS